MTDASRYASRKFILTAAAILIATGLLVAGLIDGKTWASFTTWVLGLYFAGNVGSYLASVAPTLAREKTQQEIAKSNAVARGAVSVGSGGSFNFTGDVSEKNDHR